MSIKLGRMRKAAAAQAARTVAPVKIFLDDADCLELSIYMDAMASCLRDLCKASFRTAAR